MTMITPSYLGETIEYSSLHACRSTLEDPTRSSSPIICATRSIKDRSDNRSALPMLKSLAFSSILPLGPQDGIQTSLEKVPVIASPSRPRGKTLMFGRVSNSQPTRAYFFACFAVIASP